MTGITATSSKTLTAETFVEAALTEDVKFHTVRANGTTRRIRVLTGKDLEVAEWVMEQREEGRTMKDIANEMSVSVPTLRRLINRYLLTEEVANADQEEAQEWAEFINENKPEEEEVVEVTPGGTQTPEQQKEATEGDVEETTKS